jgi:hypothetical protein
VTNHGPLTQGHDAPTPHGVREGGRVILRCIMIVH